MCVWVYFSCATLELERDGFCQNPFFECLVAEIPEEHKADEGKRWIMTFCFYCRLACVVALSLSAQLKFPPLLFRYR